MVTVISGNRDGGTNYLANQRKLDMRDEILLLKPAKYPLTVLLSKIPKKKAINPKFYLMEDELMPNWDAVNNAGGYAAGDTSIVVDNGAYFEAYQTVAVPRTGEVFRVTAVSTNTLTVVRGSGAAALNDNEPLLIIADGYEEGTTTNSAKSIVLTERYNYCQTIKTKVGITETENATDLYGTSSDLDYQRNKRGEEHALKIEKAFWFGKRALVTGATGSKPQRFTGGIFEFISTNVTDAGAMLTEFSWEMFLEDAMKYGSETKWCFMASRPISVVNAWAKDKMQIVNGEKAYGLTIMKLNSPHGTINIVHHPLFEGNVYGYYAVILDLNDKCVEYTFLQGRDTFLKTNVQDPDADAEEDRYLSDVGIALAQEKRHALMTNIQS